MVYQNLIGSQYCVSRMVSSLIVAAACLLIGTTGCDNTPQDPVKGYPRKTVTVICPWATGGGTDQLSRFWASALEEEFDNPFVVVNKTGGGGSRGHGAGARARPDGNTLTMITFELSTMHRMGKTDLTYRDFAPILQMNADPAAIIVKSDAKWNSLRAFLDDVKQNPGEITMSGTAFGGAWDLARVGLLLADGQKVDAVKWIPNQGAAPSLTQLLGGHIDAVCCSIPEAADKIQAGGLKALAVMADERLDDFPDVPTAKEEGVDWTVVGWRGLAAPKDTPPELVALLEEKCRKIAESKKFREFMKKLGYVIRIRGADEFHEFLAQQDKQWKNVVEAAGYAAE